MLVAGASPLSFPALPSVLRGERRGCFRAEPGLGTVGSRPELVAARLVPAAADSGSRPEAARDMDSADAIGRRPDGACEKNPKLNPI